MQEVFDFVDLILTGIGVVSSLSGIIMLGLDKLGYYSWIGIQIRSKKLIKQINAQHFTPDVIIGVGRSGAVLGGILAGNLGVKPISVIDRRYIWEDGKFRKTEIISLLNLDLLRGKSILLVDAAPHTGNTCKEIREELLKANPKDLKVASLFKVAYTVLVPDFYIDEVQKVRKMPWRFSSEYREDFTRKKE